jgi:hypothetical protein
MKTRLASVGLDLLAASAAARALEPLKIYDRFATAPINGNLWTNAERSSQVKGGQLLMSERLYSRKTDDTGEYFEVFRTTVSNPTAVTEMKATVTVDALEVNACAANATTGSSRARVSGSYFNAGTPVAGSGVDDILGVARVIRFSNSTDPAGTYQVQGQIIHCLDEECNASTVVQTVSLGTVTTGTPVTLEVQWDHANHQFIFTRDSNAPVDAPYTLADTQPPGEPYKDLDLRVDVANCTAAPVTGYVNASFDNVFVNRSAAP